MTDELDAMRDAIGTMFGKMGIESVEFDDGDSIACTPPPDVAHTLPAHGGGTVSVKAGDRVRVWVTIDDGSFVEEAVGTLIGISPEPEDGWFTIAYNKDDRGPTEGASSSIVRPKVSNDIWARVIEKIEDYTGATDGNGNPEIQEYGSLA